MYDDVNNALLGSMNSLYYHREQARQAAARVKRLKKLRLAYSRAEANLRQALDAPEERRLRKLKSKAG